MRARTVRITAATAAAALVAGCGSASHPRKAAPPADPDTQARAALVRAAADIHAFARAHHTFDVGGVAGLHTLDPSTAIVNFVDGRQTSFFIAVEPPTTKTIWRYDFDHNATSRAQCLPGPGRKCRAMRRW